MPTYMYKCPECGGRVEIVHTIQECSEPRLCPSCPSSEMRRELKPVMLVGPRTKPGSKEVNATREHEQQRNIRRKRGEPS